VLREIELPGTQNGHPITNEVDGRQFIMLSGGGRGQAPELEGWHRQAGDGDSSRIEGMSRMLPRHRA
jgi:hypothetical protein